MKSVSDEEIVAAIFQCRTIEKAAEAVGLSRRAMYDRMQERSFKALYERANTDILREAVLKVNASLSKAVDVIADIMNDQRINAAVRLQAAGAILNHAEKLGERLKLSAKAEEDAADGSTDDLIRELRIAGERC